MQVVSCLPILLTEFYLIVTEDFSKFGQKYGYWFYKGKGNFGDSFIHVLYIMNITHILRMYYILGIAVSSDDAKIYEKLFLPS